MVILSEVLVGWRSSEQCFVEPSYRIAKCIAVSECAQTVRCYSHILQMVRKVRGAAMIYVEKQACIELAIKNRMRRKHMKLSYHIWPKAAISKKNSQKYRHTAEMSVEILTKLLGLQMFPEVKHLIPIKASFLNAKENCEWSSCRGRAFERRLKDIHPLLYQCHLCICST